MTIVSINITGKGAEVGMRLAEFCGAHGLTYTLSESALTRALTPADAAHIKGPTNLPERKVPAAAAAKRTRKRSAKPRRDRTIKVTAEETTRIVALLRKLDTGDGVATEAVYEALGGKTTHWQSVLGTLRKRGDVKDNGKGQRALRVFAPAGEETVKHGSQTLVNLGVARRRQPKVVEAPAE